MKITKSLSMVAMSLALAGGFATPAFADLPKAPSAISQMDTNKNGRIEKQEYMDYMSKAFDKTAGAKGYCTFEEVEQGFRQMLNPGP